MGCKQAGLSGERPGAVGKQNVLLLGKNGADSRNAAKIPYFCVKF